MCYNLIRIMTRDSLRLIGGIPAAVARLEGSMGPFGEEEEA